jgi:hypothetical protein
MTINCVLTIVLFYSAAVHAAENYLTFEQRINSITYKLNPNENLEQVLRSKGHIDIRAHQGAYNQTLWKNGFTQEEIINRKKVMTIVLPYSAGAKTISRRIVLPNKKESYLQYIRRINSIVHTLSPGETLPEVLSKKGYQNLKGQHGDINQTLWKNGIEQKDIKKMAWTRETLILPYQPIEKLGNKKRERSIASQPRSTKNVKKAFKKRELPPEYYEFRSFLTINYGINYFSLDQSQTNADVSIGDLNHNTYKIEGGLRYEDFEFRGQYGGSSYKYKDSASSGRDTLNSVLVEFQYKNFLVVGAVGQTPLFFNDSVDVARSKMTTVSSGIGYQFTKRIPGLRRSFFKSKISFLLPHTTNTADRNFGVNSLRGFSTLVNFSYERTFYESTITRLSFVMESSTSLDQYRFDMKYNEIGEKIRSSNVNSRFLLGFKSEF